MSSEISKRYSQALFELEKDEGTIKEFKEEVVFLQQVLEENPELMDFFNAVKISKDEKKAFIEEIFHDLSTYFKHFLMLLIDKNRMSYLNEMLSDLLVLTNEELGIVTAKVYSARSLKQEDLDRIQNALQTKMKKTIQMETHVDPSLLAGIKVVVGSNVTDVSMAHSLESLKQALLKKGEIR